MKKQKRSMLILSVMVACVATGLFLPGLIAAGDLEPSSPPGSTMHTLDEIYNKLVTGCIECDNAPVAKTGQTDCWDASGNSVSCAGTGQDAELQIGVAWPNPRFTDNGDGTVTDNLTSLIWLKNANCFGVKTWANALSDCNGLSDGSCGLTDGSVAGDWRLPNVRELHSLIDYGSSDPALPSGHPFTGVQSNIYWSSSTFENITDSAWNVYMNFGIVYDYPKTVNFIYVWPVRGGN